MSSEQDFVFTLSRSFDAPRALVWQLHTEAQHLEKWFGPKGWTTTCRELELRPGGRFLYQMRMADGSEMWGRWIFREIVAPERLVVIVSFSDPEGGVTVHPMAPNWPRETLSTTTFTEAAGKTTVHLRWQAYNATDLQRDTFKAGAESMRQGWTGTMDQLEAYLATLR